MIADAHIHLFRHGYWRKRGLSPLGTTSDLAAYARFRRQHQIGQSLVVGYEGDDIDPTNNDYIARLVAQHNWIVPLAYFDENATADAVARHLAAGHCGIALYLEDAAAAARLKRWPGFAECRACRDSRAWDANRGRPAGTIPLFTLRAAGQAGRYFSTP